MHFTDPRPVRMMLKSLAVVTLSLIGLGSAVAQPLPTDEERLAPEVQGPDYTARVPLEANTQEARDAALRDALVQVFERASGGGLIPAHYRDRARDWVDNFNLDRDAEGLGLRASFNPQSIDDAVADIGLPLWGARRYGADRVEVQLANVSSPERYAEVMRQLSDDRRVERVEIQSLNGTDVRLSVMVEGGRQALVDLLGSRAYADNSDNPFSQALRLELR